MFHNIWMHKPSKQSHFQQEQLVPLNRSRPNTRCLEVPDSASMRDRSTYKPQPQTLGSTRQLTYLRRQ